MTDPETPGSGPTGQGLTGPLRSKAESFPYYATGGALYLVGALLVLYGVAGTAAALAEVVFLLAGSGVVAYAFLVDRGTVRPPAR